jgi:hypothetical protein
MSPSEGSLSDTSSIRACDMVAGVIRRGLRSRRGEDRWWGLAAVLKRARDEPGRKKY